MSAQASRFVTLRGQAISGRRTASERKDPNPQISDFFGEPEVPGTLNVALEQPVWLDQSKVTFSQVSKTTRTKRSHFWPAEINGLRCLVYRSNGHPLHIVEICATCRLREKFKLNDGDPVELKFASNLIKKLPWVNKIIWAIFWEFRTHWYASAAYRNLIGPFWWVRRRATQSPEYRIKFRKQKKRTPISVCHINLARNPKLRGGERQTKILVDALAAEGVPLQQVILLRHGPLAGQLLNSPSLKVRLVRNRFSAFFACRGATLLHAHEAHAAQVAYAASLCWRTKYLITRRLTKLIRSNPYSSAVYRNAQVIAVLTKAVEDSIRKRLPKVPVVCIPSAWHYEPPNLDAVDSIRQKFAGKFLIGHVAAMDGTEKGHSVLIQSARILQDDFPEIQFLLVGSGQMEEKFRQQADDLKNVSFVGWVENPNTWIVAFNLFAFPSLNEALGSTLLDVLRAGVPIVASQVGGIPEIITSECGILVPPGDAKTLANELARLYESEELRMRLSKAGKERAELYSPKQLAQKYLEVYQGLEGIKV